MYTYVHLHTTVARHAGRPEDNSLGGDSCCLSVSVICTSLELGVTPRGCIGAVDADSGMSLAMEP